MLAIKDEAGMKSADHIAYEVQRFGAYDERKRLIKSIDAAGNVTRYRYTPLSAETLAHACSEGQGNHPGQLEAVIHPDGSEEQLRHDAEGRLLTHTDALQRSTAYRCTAAGLIAQRTDALRQSLQYRWTRSATWPRWKTKTAASTISSAIRPGA